VTPSGWTPTGTKLDELLRPYLIKLEAAEIKPNGKPVDRETGLKEPPRPCPTKPKPSASSPTSGLPKLRYYICRGGRETVTETTDNVETIRKCHAVMAPKDKLFRPGKV
jgi:hypothetical protein